MSAARPKRRSRLVLLAICVLFFAGAGEIALRVIGVEGETVGIQGDDMEIWRRASLLVSDRRPGVSYSNRPTASAEMSRLTYSHDERGRRITPGEAQPDAPTVVFLGDSTTYGLGVDAADTLPAHVAAALEGAITPLNLGVPGYATAQETALYVAEQPHLNDPELIVLVFFSNDSSPATWRWDDSLKLLYYDPLPLPVGASQSLWGSALYRGISSLMTSVQRSRGLFDVTTESNIAWTLDELSKLSTQVSADGRQLLVAHLPALVSLDPYQFAAQRDALAHHCDELGVPFVDLLDALLVERDREIGAREARTGVTIPDAVRREYLQRFWVLPEDPHPGGAAYALVAEPLAAKIAELLEL